MVNSVHIQNFKSLQDLKFEASRVNVFIGEPNTGKTNIIEALAFFSVSPKRDLHEILRFRTTADLFFDQKVTNRLVVAHNPYVLGSVIAKTPVKDLAVFVTELEGFCTRLKPVSGEGLSRILDYGPDTFLNLGKLAEG